MTVTSTEQDVATLVNVFIVKPAISGAADRSSVRRALPHPL